MALIECADCGTNVSDAATSCPNCGRPNELRRGWKKAVPLATLLLAAGASAGYYLGWSPARGVSAGYTAATDISGPLSDFRAKRLLREHLRTELVRLVEFQQEYWDKHGEYAPEDKLPRPSEDVRREFGVYQDGVSWLASVGHSELPRTEICAVAVERVPVYVKGVPLRRSGKVRCIYDLSIRLARMMS